jgi:hypothetical protein
MDTEYIIHLAGFSPIKITMANCNLTAEQLKNEILKSNGALTDDYLIPTDVALVIIRAPNAV